MSYPRKIKLTDDKLKKLLQEKAELVSSGRISSYEIEDLEKQMEDIDAQLKEIEKSIDMADLQEKGRIIAEKVDGYIKDMKGIEEEMHARLKEKSPTELIEKYDTVKKEKETKEEERNRIALKVQKYSDKIIPLTRKLLTPYLTEKGDDYDSIRLEDGEIVGTVFNHFDDFAKNWDKKHEKN